ncbi:hypothetical protein EC973_006654 [Apophysomyces ossiformis]|uniref:Heme peroxidase n=1 Tax=Apophysomyces ossiformis TaxID=679940 RepID=A0A8H7BVB2_9FUNG|nr:hypothetical protein EC973_006654 [Apophysomyces ossiformis]
MSSKESPQAAKQATDIEKEAGVQGLYRTLEALVLEINPWAPGNPAVEAVETLLNNIRSVLRLTTEGVGAIREALFTTSSAQQRELATALVQRLLQRAAPINDRENAFENLINIFSNAKPDDRFKDEMEALISVVSNSLNRALEEGIQKPFLNLLGNEYRSADGSGNGVLCPDVGKSGSRYSRTVSSTSRLFTNLPDPDVVFDRLLKRPQDQFRPHQSNINTILFYLATVITHDLFASHPEDVTVNLTTGYLDLTPLYGQDVDEQKKVREMTGGLLKPDQWADRRFNLHPPGAGILLILFSRNHNFIAKRLLDINENERFSFGKGKPLRTKEEQDEILFQTARLNIILHEYLRTILGLDVDSEFILNPVAEPSYPMYGNQVSIEFNYVYRWHAAISKRDEKRLDAIKPLIERNFQAKRKGEKPASGQAQSIFNFPRDPRTGNYQDSELIRELYESHKEVAGELGSGLNTPAVMKEIEINGINQSRKAKTCSFNDFRRHFNLQPLTQFADFSDDPKVQEALKDLYGDVENVELFTGLRVEKSGPRGLRLPYTMQRAILTDAVNLVRNDRIMSQSFTPAHLTNWGYEYQLGDPNNAGRVLPAMLRELLPGAFADNPAIDIFRVPSSQ